MQDCIYSIVSALGLPQSCSKPSICTVCPIKYAHSLLFFFMLSLSYRPKWIPTLFTYPPGLLNLQWGPTSSEVIMKGVGNIDLHQPPPQIRTIQHIDVKRNGHYFADDIFKCILLNENVWILKEMSLNCVSWGRIDNYPALAQIMAWRWTGDSVSMSRRVWNHFEMHCICHI